LFSAIWQARETRNGIKSEYRRLRENIRQSERFELEFEDTAKLGDILEYFHYRLLSVMKKSCYETTNGKFEPIEGNQHRIQRRLHIQIYLVKAKNVLSFLFWMIFLLAIVGLIAAISAGVATHVSSQI